MTRIRIGTDNFKSLRDEDGYFVDKSMLVREVLDGNKCVLLPRPRRFGKTLNLSMLRYFFSATHADERGLFEDLAIAQDEEAMSHQGGYPVIHISLKSIRGGPWELAHAKLADRIATLFDEHHDVVQSLGQADRETFERVSARSADLAELQSSLAKLITWLHKHHNKPVIVLIDEYDTPIIEGWSKGYYDSMMEFMRAWLGEGLKHEEGDALFRAVVTGILRVGKESIFSGLNNLETWSMLSPGRFASSFGFTQSEVDALADDFGVSDASDPIREWYNGYSFGGTTIYNPWSVLNFVNRYPEPACAYWLNTASNELVYEELENGGLDLKRDLEKLIVGDTVRYPLIESIAFSDIGKSRNNIWSFLYFSGYLRAEAPEVDFRGQATYALSIPNREIFAAYQRFVEIPFMDSRDCDMESFLEWFLEGQPASELQRILRGLVTPLVSVHDLARQPEAVFHAFMLGLLANLRRVYEIRSNAEAGYGRADIMLCPKTTEYPFGYVIEFKSIGSDSDVDATLTQALYQIDDKAYAIQLRESGVEESKLKRLAIVLQGKFVYIREA